MEPDYLGFAGGEGKGASKDHYRFVRERLVQCGVKSHDIDELTQHVIVTAVRRRDDFDVKKGPYEAWLSGLARLTARAHIRRARVLEKRHVTLDGEDYRLVEGPAIGDLENTFEYVISSLGEPDCNILKLRFKEQLQTKEIAERLSMSHDAVRQRLARAIDRMRQDPSVRLALIG